MLAIATRAHPFAKGPMQKTSLSTLSTRTVARLGSIFANPWRRLMVLVLAVLLGFFISAVVFTSTGQRADLDVTAAAICLAGVEAIGIYVYRQRGPRPFWVPALNFFKIGFTYGCFLEAFKLGS